MVTSKLVTNAIRGPTGVKSRVHTGVINNHDEHLYFRLVP